MTVQELVNGKKVIYAIFVKHDESSEWFQLSGYKWYTSIVKAKAAYKSTKNFKDFNSFYKIKMVERIITFKGNDGVLDVVGSYNDLDF